MKLDLIGLIQLKRKTTIIAVFPFSYFIVAFMNSSISFII
nr:MAG TPA: hypothetical protein [Caudoviricetes sp.]